MKNYMMILVSLITVSCVQSPEKKKVVKRNLTTSNVSRLPEISSDKVPANLAEIKDRYLLVSAQLERGTLDSVSLDYNCSGEKRGKAIFFSEHGKLRAIKHTYSEYDHFSATDMYFVQGDTLYFAFLHQVTWSFVSGGAIEGVNRDRTKERRFYLTAAEPLLCLEKVYVTRSDSTHSNISSTTNNTKGDCKDVPQLKKAFDKLISLRTSRNAFCN